MYQDGNALAGPLTEIFAVDMTSAESVCAGCGRAGAVASLRVYWHAGDAVVRCPGCEQVVFRLVRLENRLCLEVTGLRRLTFS
ncbi:DUF6510 family protein [Fodinicola acaciae]|uniref:DUF6510 family protein n=1 Tax=Fodinicola acaciae TaxID=2681555 RepID=UPI0013CFC2EE|nr:DUF6510 family protein [Fodinicola acaciae]